MPRGEQTIASAGRSANVPVGFIAACAVAFGIAIAGTIHFCRSMCCEMEMPGGWTMSTMWMRMPGHTWAGSAASFLLMWLAMMVAMMMPSALPMFLNHRRSLAGNKSAESGGPVALMALGYFAMWLALGAVIYGLGIAFTATAMRWESFSRAVPVLSGAALIAAGAIQFTRWKRSGLLRCRNAMGSAAACPAREGGFLFGCTEGAACCACCTGPIIVQLALGMMNPFVIVGITVVIAAERFLPHPKWAVRIFGFAAIVAGICAITAGAR